MDAVNNSKLDDVELTLAWAEASEEWKAACKSGDPRRIQDAAVNYTVLDDAMNARGL